jgi:transcriptional regulator with XRE-family HTH domain
MSRIRPPTFAPASVEVARLLKQAVDGQGLSVRDAAKKAGITYQTLGSWLRGARQPSAPALIEVLRALGYPAACFALFGDVVGGVDEVASADAAAGRALRRLGWTAPSAAAPGGAE